MSLEVDLQPMARHLVDIFKINKSGITIADGSPAFNLVGYGEPKVIAQWPYLSVQPQQKSRELKATRKFGIEFTIWLIIYHGLIASTLEIQEGSQSRAEAVEAFLHTDFRWNFIDSSDSALDKVIFGFVELIDHPVVIAPGDELWSSSRLIIKATSQEVF